MELVTIYRIRHKKTKEYIEENGVRGWESEDEAKSRLTTIHRTKFGPLKDFTRDDIEVVETKVIEGTLGSKIKRRKVDD